jgi:hypothetical protein
MDLADFVSRRKEAVMSGSKLVFIWLVIFGITLPLSVVLSTQLARRSFEKVQIRGQTITVKGYAERPIKSDFALWAASIDTRNADLVAAYKKLDADRAKVLAYLASKGFKGDGVQQFEVSILKRMKRDEKGNLTNAIEFYELSQRVQIYSNDVLQLSTVARDSAGLIQDGVELAAEPPRYFYTKLDDMKLTMLAEASQNARDRAEKLITGGSSTVGELKSASQGVFQITPPLTTETSGSGENDTSSIDKVIKAVVTCEYEIR